MSTVERHLAAPPESSQLAWLRSNWGLLLAIAAFAAILLLPTPAGLPVAGHRMLAVLAFAVIVWMTEALDYAVSALVIAALMAFVIGLSPNPARHVARRDLLALARLRVSGHIGGSILDDRGSNRACYNSCGVFN